MVALGILAGNDYAKNVYDFGINRIFNSLKKSEIPSSVPVVKILDIVLQDIGHAEALPTFHHAVAVFDRLEETAVESSSDESAHQEFHAIQELLEQKKKTYKESKRSPK